jgi:centromeric protein E
MEDGEVHRQYGSTNMNDRSSRSHTIFRIVIESRERQNEKQEGKNILNNLHIFFCITTQG